MANSGREWSARKTAYLGLLTALAIVLGYVESLIPFDFAVPGIKLGLCNVAILIVLELYSWREAIIVTVIRVIVIGFLFGNMFSIAYGMAGALLSILVMTLLLKTDRFTLIGVSAAGGTAHNIGQILVAFAVAPTLPLLWYMPVLMLAGDATGILIGIIVSAVLPRIRKSGYHLGSGEKTVD
ncbi:MAG: Gx transporter family protein [Eubacteriales bacterium]|jgi:heptaprenyl diphosphate synthase